ncbi:MAG: pitrilysin family protein, partial [Dokdonella sp.]
MRSGSRSTFTNEIAQEFSMKRFSLLRRSLICALVGWAAFGAGIASAADSVEIPFTKTVLPNGLTLIVSEDHKAPVVAISVWFHVGSADEPAGKTGFAHLFEHLKFVGSENHKGTYDEPFELAGTTDANGTTWFDRTNYFATVPNTAVDMALWMESDGMGHLLGAVTQEKLDIQRGVVQNEKRQGENRPYGRVDEVLLKQIFPANHPYQHDTIGSMADLDAASLDDVKTWYRDYYGAANAVIVMVGDIDTEVAKAKVLKYFGDIPAGPPVPRQQPWTAARSESTRAIQHDHVAQTRIIREWNVPHDGDADTALLNLAAYALGGGKTSRLYQRLVYKDKLVDDVSVGVQAFALASQFVLSADIKNGVEQSKVEAAIADEWKKFLAEGPTADEVERAQISTRANFIRGLEKVGGFGGKAVILAEGEVYRDNPAAYKEDLARIAAATPEKVKAAANRWLVKGDHTLSVIAADKNADFAAEDAAVKGLPAAPGKPEAVLPPKREYTTIVSDVDRSLDVPAVTQFPDLTFPEIQRGKLKNGINVVLAERHTIPVTQVLLQFDAGYAADSGRKAGTAAFVSAMLDEGTESMDSIEISRAQERLGARIGASASLDASSVGLNALNDRLPDAMALFADVVRHPAFSKEDVARIRAQWLAAIEQEKTQPQSIALRVLPPLLYGDKHPYGIPFTGTGQEATIKALTIDDLKRFHADYYRPDNVTILVAGDTTLPAITAELEKAFGDWKAPETAVPTKVLAKVAAPTRPRIFLIDRPDSPQSLIIAGSLIAPTSTANNLDIVAANDAFGGSFTSRLNTNLRETKHWAYGASAFTRDAVGQRPLMLYAPVQSDKTAESMAEILKETREMIGSRPITSEEITKVKANSVRSLPGNFETTASVLGTLAKNAQYDRPDDYITTLKQRIDAQKAAGIEAAAKEIYKPDALTWVVVGDLKQIEKPIR